MYVLIKTSIDMDHGVVIKQFLPTHGEEKSLKSKIIYKRLELNNILHLVTN